MNVTKPTSELIHLLPFSSGVLVQSHVVICGYIDSTVTDLIGTLRKQSLSKTIPVVVMFESPPSIELHLSISGFSDVNIVVGSLMDPKTLSAANITAAAHIILLANPFAKAQNDVHDQVGTCRRLLRPLI